jgi:S-adenosylmethionine decarboxylase
MGKTTHGSPRSVLHDFAGDIVKNRSESDAPCCEADAVDESEEREVKKMKC